MTNYGFRLFKLEIKRNGRGDNMPVDQIEVNEKKLHFRDYLYELAQGHVDDIVHGSPPRLRDLMEEADDEDNDHDADEGDDDADESDDNDGEVETVASRPVLMITKVSLRGTHVVINYVFGRQLGYTQAGYSEGSSDRPIDIRNLKSVRPYRAVFILPEKGASGVCAVEDASRTCPHKRLEQWLRAWARVEAREDEARKREETGKKTQKTDWWSARFVPLSDPVKLTNLMKRGRSTRIVLVKEGDGAATRTAGRSSLRIEMGLDDAPSLAKARRVLNKWVSADLGQPVSTDQETATADLAAVLGEKYAHFDDEVYDDAWIDIKDSDGNSKQVSPSRWADIFTYPVQSGVVDNPPSRLYYGRVKSTVKSLEKALKLGIDWGGWGGEKDG